MDRVSFLLPFVGIIVGLGVADLLLSVHRVARSRRRWHWLPAVWAAVVFSLALLYWWVFPEIMRSDVMGSFYGFAFHLLGPVLLFLTCAAALPDERGDTPLEAYYYGNRRYFFGLLAAYCIHGALDYGFSYGQWGGGPNLSPPWIALAAGALAAVLAVTDRRAVHVVVTGCVVALFVTAFTMFTRTL